MNIDTDHLHFWMQAIRQSAYPIRTMDAFWRGQILSKEWLISKLQELLDRTKRDITINIHGGGGGTLARMLFQSGMHIGHINCIDIDPDCERIATTMNQLEFNFGKFCAITQDMCTFKQHADIEINTSFEHITQPAYEQWLSSKLPQSLLIIQSNNYEIPEHIRIARSLDEFKLQAGLSHVMYEGELSLPLYTRYMVIGKK